MRCFVTEYHGKNMASWRCPKGHTWRGRLMKKIRGIPLPGETGLAFMAKWWRDGVTRECPTCKEKP